jgi:hypothetical protein
MRHPRLLAAARSEAMLGVCYRRRAKSETCTSGGLKSCVGPGEPISQSSPVVLHLQTSGCEAGPTAMPVADHEFAAAIAAAHRLSAAEASLARLLEDLIRLPAGRAPPLSETAGGSHVRAADP